MNREKFALKSSGDVTISMTDTTKLWCWTIQGKF